MPANTFWCPEVNFGELVFFAPSLFFTFQEILNPSKNIFSRGISQNATRYFLPPCLINNEGPFTSIFPWRGWNKYKWLGNFHNLRPGSENLRDRLFTPGQGGGQFFYPGQGEAGFSLKKCLKHIFPFIFNRHFIFQVEKPERVKILAFSFHFWTIVCTTHMQCNF